MTTSELTGEVVRAGDSGYEAARIGWNRLYSRYPEAIVFCADAQDVVNAVAWAREQEGVALRARSGRHSLEGWSSLDGGLVIDVSRMKSIEIDEAARTATVGTGLTQKETVAGARATRLCHSDRLGGRRRPRRCGPRRRLRIAHPQLGTGLRQPARRRDCGADGARSAKVVRGHRAQQLRPAVGVPRRRRRQLRDRDVLHVEAARALRRRVLDRQVDRPRASGRAASQRGSATRRSPTSV